MEQRHSSGSHWPTRLRVCVDGAPAHCSSLRPAEAAASIARALDEMWTGQLRAVKALHDGSWPWLAVEVVVAVGVPQKFALSMGAQLPAMVVDYLFNAHAWQGGWDNDTNKNKA